MATNPKTPPAPEPEKFPRKAVHLLLAKGDSEEVAARKHAALTTSPELAACRTIKAGESKLFSEQIDVPALMEHLREQAVAANGGDLSQAEAMLINQATALQSLFARLTERGMGQSQMPNLEGFMRLALRAQNQCRATLETLAAIKNPPVIYAKQVNQTTGPQQINNGATASSQARGIKNEQSKLLDAGTTGASVSSHSTLEAMGKVDRAKVGGRQG
ncbi:MAG: hypothetical protein Q8L44_09635 [Sulfuritalea sp.]|nr:hypothetical protein [Sulfuritalea sp.]